MKLLFFIITYYLISTQEIVTEQLPSICPHIITRKDWAAQKPDFVDYTIFPLDYVIIHHTVTSSCDTVEDCSAILRSIQDYHMLTNKYDDIGYNFLVDSKGNIYEGRGWHKEGAHTYGYNKNSTGIAFIGSYSDNHPTRAQLKAVQDFLKCGVEIGELGVNYQLFGGRQVIPTESPGVHLYNEIKSWSHFGTAPKRTG